MYNNVIEMDPKLPVLVDKDGEYFILELGIF